MNAREIFISVALVIATSVAVSATMMTIRADPLPRTIVAQPPMTELDATGGR